MSSMTDPVGAALNGALSLIQAGRLAEADAVCASLLGRIPEHAQALALRGLAAEHAGKLEEALAWFRRSLRSDGGQPLVEGEMAVCLCRLGRPAQALEHFDRALASSPEIADLHHNRALALAELGRHDEAASGFARTVALAPAHAAAHHALGSELRALGRKAQAVTSYENAVRRAPHDPAFISDLGIALDESGRIAEALACLSRAIALRPDRADSHYNRGLVLHKLKRLPEALQDFDRAIALEPGHAEAHNSRGTVLRDLRRNEEAIQSFRNALASRPGCVPALVNLGSLLALGKRHDEALQIVDRAIALEPDFAAAHAKRGYVLQEVGRHEEARQSYGKALALRPDDVPTLVSLGVLMMGIGRYDEAGEHLDHALRINPTEPDANWNRSLLDLLLGNYEQGWRRYESRWHCSTPVAGRAFRQPQWLGTELVAGSTILLHAEQGLGDAMQFCRYAPMVAELGARVLLEMPAPLVALARSLGGGVTVIETETASGHFDLHCPLMSLPLALGTTVSTIPAKVPYLHADSKQRMAWRSRLGDRCGPRVGLAWSGRPTHRGDLTRSLPLAALAPLLLPGCEFHAVQKDIREADLESAESLGIRLHGPALADFSDTAALVEELDLVVSVDTSVAHLCGALGKAVWILLPFAPDFRWMLDREDSPWYPSARLFRQPRAGDWTSVMKSVRMALLEFTA